MKLSSKLLLALAVTCSVGVSARCQEDAQDQVSAELRRPVPASASSLPVFEPPAGGMHPTVTRYATGSTGDHSLEQATVVEQAFARYTLYTVRLQFASGAEQSLEITAPPGGLRPELRDMSGDNVPNDVVLSSRLLGLPFVVLLNEGNDHLTVAISPGTFTAGEGRASGPGQVHHASALPSSGFRAVGLTSAGGTVLPELQENLRSPIAFLCTKRTDHRSASGRAPPALAAQI